MKSLSYIIAPFVNSTEIVLMAFETECQAVDHLVALGLRCSDHEGFYDTVTTTDGGAVPLEIVLDEMKDGDTLTTRAATLRDALFINGHYYSGNGSCCGLFIRTVPIGFPVVAFDLD